MPSHGTTRAVANTTRRVKSFESIYEYNINRNISMERKNRNSEKDHL